MDNATFSIGGKAVDPRQIVPEELVKLQLEIERHGCKRPVFNLDDYWWRDWYPTASDDEKVLIQKIYDFDELFEDLRLDNEDLPFIRPNSLAYFSYSYIRYKIDDVVGGSESCLGSFDMNTQTLSMKREMVKRLKAEDQEATRSLLHEMIHMHECVLLGTEDDSLQDIYMVSDIIRHRLYSELKTRIPQLDRIIAEHLDPFFLLEMKNWGGLHTELFLLKSFDLDIKMSYPLGTVFGYQRDEEYKKKNYFYK